MIVQFRERARAGTPGANQTYSEGRAQLVETAADWTLGVHWPGCEWSWWVLKSVVSKPTSGAIKIIKTMQILSFSVAWTGLNQSNQRYVLGGKYWIAPKSSVSRLLCEAGNSWYLINILKKVMLHYSTDFNFLNGVLRRPYEQSVSYLKIGLDKKIGRIN